MHGKSHHVRSIFGNGVVMRAITPSQSATPESLSAEAQWYYDHRDCDDEECAAEAER